jgi:hypothetical protein
VAALVTHENFVYCANFTPDIYTNYGFQYFDSNQNVKAAYAMDDFLDNKIPLWYTDATIRKNANSVFSCVKMLKMYEDAFKTKVTQQLVKDTLKEYYNIDFKTWDQPYYTNATSEDMYVVLRDIRKWIGDHQGIANYDAFFNASRRY